MAVTVRTLAEAHEAGLHLPTPFKEVSPFDFVIGHDDDDGAVMVWGPLSDRTEVERLARAYD